MKKMKLLASYVLHFFMSLVPDYTEHHPAAVYHCSHISNDRNKQIIAAADPGMKSAKLMSIFIWHPRKWKSLCPAQHKYFTFARPLAERQVVFYFILMNAIWIVMHFSLPLYSCCAFLWHWLNCGKVTVQLVVRVLFCKWCCWNMMFKHTLVSHFLNFHPAEMQTKQTQWAK